MITDQLAKTKSSKNASPPVVHLVQHREFELAQIGEIIDGKFEISKLLKHGAFGTIYEVIDVSKNNVLVALKLESKQSPIPLLEMEAMVLRDLQGRRHIPTMFGIGSVENRFDYIAMQLLGENLSQLRRSCPLAMRRFSLKTIVRLGVQCVEALQIVHDVGYVHRDFKGSNCGIGLGKDRETVYLFDFGLARQHLDSRGRPKSERLNTGFRGTTKYASISVHEHRDAGRKDDMWSLFYTLVEWFNGMLPWSLESRKAYVCKMKILTPLELLCRGLPPEMLMMGQYLGSLTYSDKPDYTLLSELLLKMAAKAKLSPTEPFDWDEDWETLKQECSC